MPNLGDIDPVGGLIGLATVILAIIALGVADKKSHSTWTTAWIRSAIGLAAVAAALLVAGVLTSISGDSDAPKNPEPGSTAIASPQSPATSVPPATMTEPSAPSTRGGLGQGGDSDRTGDGDEEPERPPPVPTVSGPIDVNLEVLTTDYRRKNLEGTEYAVYPSTGKLEFRFGWAAHTPTGDLKTDDCVVNTKLSDSDGIVIISNPSNRCSQTIGPYAYRGILEPGTYTVEVSLQHESGTSVTERKTVRVDPS